MKTEDRILGEKKTRNVRNQRNKNKFFNVLKNNSDRLILENNHSLDLRIRFLHIGWQSLSFKPLPKHRHISGILVCFSRLLPKDEVERRIIAAFKDLMG